MVDNDFDRYLEHLQIAKGIANHHKHEPLQKYMRKAVRVQTTTKPEMESVFKEFVRKFACGQDPGEFVRTFNMNKSDDMETEFVAEPGTTPRNLNSAIDEMLFEHTVAPLMPLKA